jgi:hypothetical protein
MRAPSDETHFNVTSHCTACKRFSSCDVINGALTCALCYQREPRITRPVLTKRDIDARVNDFYTNGLNAAHKRQARLDNGNG